MRDLLGWQRAATALEAAGEPWGLVNCAAVTIVRDLFEIEADEWDEVIAVNLRGPLHGIQVIGPLLRERGRAAGSSTSRQIPRSRVEG